MASRVLLQRTSTRGALRISPRVSASSALYPSTHFYTRNNSTLFHTFNKLTNANNIYTNNARNQKYFSTSTIRSKKLATMSEDELSGLKVKEDRLMRDLHETCEWGKGEVWGSAPTETGMSRLSLSDTDKQARDWFASTTKVWDAPSPQMQWETNSPSDQGLKADLLQ